MAGPIPCLGYPSRTAAVLALRSAGQSTAQIAQRVNITKKQVLALEDSAARSRTAGTAVTRVEIVPGVAALLEQAAVKRGMTIRQLGATILETVAVEKMVDAVLDDREAF